MNNGAASPSDLARELPEPLSVVSYHMRCLLRLHCIELVDTQQVRGALEHFYRPLIRPQLSADDWSNLPPEVRTSLSGQAFDEAVALASAALVAGTFDSRTDRHLSCVELELDDEAWADVNGQLDEVVEHAMQLQTASLGRSDSGHRVRSGLVLAHFERSAG